MSRTKQIFFIASGLISSIRPCLQTRRAGVGRLESGEALGTGDDQPGFPTSGAQEELPTRG